MRKDQRNTVESERNGLRDAMPQIEPPACVKLREGDLPYWQTVTRARALSEWTETDLLHAANLARCQADIERISGEIAIEGDTITNARGTEVLNPKHSLLEVLSRRAVSLSRLLQIHAQAVQGRSDRVADTRAKSAERARALNELDDLIPTPAEWSQ
jgi:hypothetical protein